MSLRYMMMQQTFPDVGDGETNSISSALSAMKTQFSLLFPRRTDDETKYLTEEQYQEKQNNLLDCLRGENDTIDLWELRELALSPGGLLEPSIRKRAWPILTAAHNVALIGGEVPSLSSNSVDAVAPSQADLEMLQRDVRRTVWNVEEHFMQQLKAKESAKAKRRVRFAPVCDVEDSPGHPVSFDEKKEDEGGPPLAVTSPTSEDANDDEDEDHPCPSPWSHTSDVSAASSSMWSHSMTSSCRRLSFRRASTTEQKIVSNVVTSVLRTAAPDNEAFEDDRFHYYTGLHDLTALLMVNLESPSLSSIVLGKLAVYHLRDAMRRERAVLESALQLMLFPMLRQVDPELHAHITTKAGLTLPTFARGWVSSWFATDVVDIAAASRLLDVFMVSHATMPIYCAVALLTVNRKRILECSPELREVYHTVRNLSLMVIEDDDDITVTSNRTAAARTNAMVHVEQVIALAIHYMKRFSPETLVALASKKEQRELLSMVPAIAMLQKSQIPAWCTADTSPNEWGILQRAKALRSGTDATEVVAAFPINAEKYPLAMIASGKVIQRIGRPKLNMRFLSRLLVFIVAALFVINKTGNRDVKWFRDRHPKAPYQKPTSKAGSRQLHDVVVKPEKVVPSSNNGMVSMLKVATMTKEGADDVVDIPHAKAFQDVILPPIRQRASKFGSSVTTATNGFLRTLGRRLKKSLQHVELARVGKFAVISIRDQSQKAATQLSSSMQVLKESAIKVGRSIQHPLSDQEVELCDFEKSFNDAILAPTHKIVARIGRNIQNLIFAKAAPRITTAVDTVSCGMKLGAVAVEMAAMDLVASTKDTVEKVAGHINVLIGEVQKSDPNMIKCRGTCKSENN